MSCLHSTMIAHQKGKDLTFQDRVIIQTRLQDHWSPNRIAQSLHCASNTVRNEIKRGMVSLYHGKQHRYHAQAGQKVHDVQRKRCGRKCRYWECHDFIDYTEQHFHENHWSFDAARGRALWADGFTKPQVVCTRTLYRYSDIGLLNVKPTELPEKLKRKTHRKHVRQNKKKLGRSIETRPEVINERERFGDWECDLVLGHKTKHHAVLLTLYERLSREFLILPLPNKDAATIKQAFVQLHDSFAQPWDQLFKTITTDNGAEFSTLSDLEKLSQTLVYYAHPYTSCDKGGIERHNGLIRRFIPKGRAIEDYSLTALAKISNWCNSLPRKILHYQTPEEVFQYNLAKLEQTA